jgi:hypothetical protein
MTFATIAINDDTRQFEPLQPRCSKYSYRRILVLLRDAHGNPSGLAQAQASHTIFIGGRVWVESQAGYQVKQHGHRGFRLLAGQVLPDTKMHTKAEACVRQPRA